MSEFSRAILAAYQRMPQWRQDQFDAAMRDAGALLERLAVLMNDWEQQGLAAAEQHANTEETG